VFGTVHQFPTLDLAQVAFLVPPCVYPSAPGIYTAEQIAGWGGVTEAVHAHGGRIFMQIAHNGRNSHSSLMPDGALPVAPSSVPPAISALTKAFQQVTAEIPILVGTFRQAALSAIEAGFDGVDLQGANGHLIEQSLEDGTNKRSDIYGGSKENRARFLLDVVEEVGAAIGKDRLGVRLSPVGQYGGIHDINPLELFTFVIKELNRRGIAYLHLIEARGSEIGLTDELHENAVTMQPSFARHSTEFFFQPLPTHPKAPHRLSRKSMQMQSCSVVFSSLIRTS
jgi:N-ethylmaleimide reductase